MTEFKPIGLSNVVYKIIVKVLANQLKAIRPHIISENQSAFLSECLSSLPLKLFTTLTIRELGRIA